MRQFVVLLLLWKYTEQLTEDQPRGPWHLAFKAVFNKTSGSHQDFYSLYASTDKLNVNDPKAFRDFSRDSLPFRSGLLDDWHNKKISVQTIKLSFFKDGKEQKLIVFNGMGMGKDDWMNCNNILYSSYNDIKTESKQKCNIGKTEVSERFAILKKTPTGAPCNQVNGWIYARDRSSTYYTCQNDHYASFPETQNSQPYFLYSKTSSLSLFSSSTDIEMADSMAVFVQVWDMVFKGVVGQESLLWKVWSSGETRNANNGNVQILTNSNQMTYKSSVVNNWTFYNIDRVKYSMFQNGDEKAFIVFDGGNTNQTNWFDNSNILYSYYTDIKDNKDVCSIEGDGTRRWQVQRASNADCNLNNAWMMVLDDPSGSTPCTFDSRGAARPFFLYSKSTTSSNFQTGGTFNSASVGEATVMGVFVHGWHTVLKISSGVSMNPHSSLYDLWTSNSTLNPDSAAAKSPFPGSPNHKSPIINNWDTYQIRAVKISLYKGGVEKIYVVLDATTANITEWFDCSRLLFSSYTDLPTVSSSLCTLQSTTNGQSVMLLDDNSFCDNTTGWFVTIDDSAQTQCSWENGTDAMMPKFFYSDSTTKSSVSNMVEADSLVIALDMDECTTNPCINGATCESVAGAAYCHCQGEYFGDICQHRHGNWSAWSNWTSCPVSCGGAIQNRTRMCDSPEPIGTEGTCVGNATEIQICNDQPCPIHGNWSVWTEWSNCTAPCGTGYYNRTRQCNDPMPQYGGDNCTGNATEESTCNTFPCPINGVWSQWSNWSECSLTCNAGGVLTRTRACDSPAPQYGGTNCTGVTMETEPCNQNITCPPVDGGFGEWSNWTQCSASCAGGNWTRTRECNNPVPDHGGANCTGNYSDMDICNTQPCPIDGGWGNWSDYANCSNYALYGGRCGDGERIRSRSCDTPAPQFGGASCSGNATDSLPCYLNCSIVCPDRNSCIPDNSCGQPVMSIVLITVVSLLIVISHKL